MTFFNNKKKMKNYFKSFAFFSVLFLILNLHQIIGQGIEPITNTNLRAGVAKVDITPPIGIPLGGYKGRNGLATGIHDPLHAVILVFDDGEKRAAIISLDIIQLYYQVADSIRNAIEKTIGIQGDYIIINASHTHSSPWPEEDVHYQNEFIAKIVGATRIAASRLRPVSLGYGEGGIDFNINRRFIDAEGRCHSQLNPEGLCDHRVKVLRLDDGDSLTPMAVLMHAVCHSNVFRAANTEVSADFPGIAQTFVERSFGNPTIAMFLQGCTGEIRPNLPEIDSEGDGFGRSGSEADMIWCGWTLGAEAVKVATKLRVHEQLIQRESNFQIEAAMNILELQADAEKLKERTWSRYRIEDGKCLLTVRVLKIGNIWFVSLPGEPVVEYGFKIEKSMKELGNIFVLGYSAVEAAYIPAEHMFAEGGYEVEVPYMPSCEKVVLNGVNQLVKEVLEKSK